MGLAEKPPNNRRLAIASAFLIANTFVWYFLAARILEGTINSVATDYFLILEFWSLHFGALTLSFILGTLLIKRIEKRLFLTIWTLIGTASPFALFIIDFSKTPVTLLISVLFGVSVGLGMPICMESFTKLTGMKNRGVFSGLIIFFSGLGFFGLALINTGAIAIGALILLLWRLPSVIISLFSKTEESGERKKDVSFVHIFRQRSFLLYLIPWVMFSLVNYLSVPVQDRVLGEATVNLLMIIENVLVGIFAVVAGVLLDRFGRKRIAMVGFILLGIGYSVVGLYPEQMTSWFFYTTVDGIAWGIFYVIFVMLIWGDLSLGANSSKFYAIGVLPFFISKYLQLVLGNYVAIDISPYALFSFIAFFLFLAVLPLVYAPETLPEKVMKDRDLKSYIENAKKKVQKESDKANKGKSKQTNEKTQDSTKDKDYEDAAKLAEKYY